MIYYLIRLLIPHPGGFLYQTAADIGLVHISYGNTYTDMVVMWSTSRDVICHVSYMDSGSTIHERSKSTDLKHSSWNAAKFIHRGELKVTYLIFVCL